MDASTYRHRRIDRRDWAHPIIGRNAAITSTDTGRITDEGIRALRAGRFAEARSLLERAAGNPRALLPLADAQRASGDVRAAQATLGALLAHDPGNVAALLTSGDIAAASDTRAACAFYQAALANAGEGVARSLHAPLARAQAYLAESADSYAAHLTDRLRAGGVDDTVTIPRVRHAIDLLTGKREIFLQRPSSFYFPGLAQIEVFARDRFDWLPEVEAATPSIRAELDAVLDTDKGFAPYVETREGRPPPRNHLRDDPSWGAFYLWKGGHRVAGNADRCPATLAALAAAPMPIIPDRSPMALFSLLKPGTHIKPHHGLLNTRLIVHLPLIAPAGCALRVGSQTHEWRTGEALIFDDSIEHEAWNRGTETRVVLLFEIWRPELDAAERAALTVLFTAVGEFVDQGG